MKPRDQLDLLDEEESCDDARLQRLFDETALVPAADQLERWADHARRVGQRPAAEGLGAWLHRLRWPVLIPAAAATLALAGWGVWAWWPARNSALSTLPSRPAGQSGEQPVASVPEVPVTVPQPVAEPEEEAQPDDALAGSEAEGDDDDWAGPDDLDLLHPPEGEVAQRMWLQAIEEDLNGGG